MSVPPPSSGSVPPVITPPPGSSTPIDVPTAAKRKFEEVLASMGDAPIPVNKRAKRDSLETKTQLDKLVSMAKFSVRAVNPFLDIGLVLLYGSEARWGPAVDEAASNANSQPDSARQEQLIHVKAFDKMLSISLGSLEVLGEFHKVDAHWKRLIALFRKQSSTARQNDTSGLKHKLSYVLHDPSQPLLPKIPDSSSKSDRGINHPMLRDAIIPWPLRIQINEKEVADDEAAQPVATAAATAALKALMRGKTIDKKPALTAKQDSYPSCFYAEGAFDPDDPEKGLFRSQFILRVLRHIWTAPSSALHGAKKVPRMCNARTHGQMKVTPEMLGYACVQARTLISTSDWTHKDGKYNYEKLFANVVDLFEVDETDVWAVETLEWLTRGVFNAGEDASDVDDSSEEDDSAPASIVARRAARRGISSTPST
ncbi:hypothetical protein K438DRAFT_2032079, partial [Mycena galopus ATCC 62051]